MVGAPGPRASPAAGLLYAIVLRKARVLKLWYTRPWGDRLNARTKDLVDLLCLIEAGGLDESALATTLAAVFGGPLERAIPETLPAPPPIWRQAFAEMAAEVACEQRISMRRSPLSRRSGRSDPTDWRA